MAMTRPSVNPGRVEWSGERSCIFLRKTGYFGFTTVAAFVQAVLSPHGRGSMAIMLGSPDEESGWPDALNLVLTDNQSLARWLLDGWVGSMPPFAARKGLAAAAWGDLHSVARKPGDLCVAFSTTLRGSGIEIELAWNGLGEPQAVFAGADQSETGGREMRTVAVEAMKASVTVNGTRLDGEVGTWNSFGKERATAWRGLSETWTTPEAG